MSLPDTLPQRLDRTVVIAAEPDTVFRFFTDPARWAAWWGAGSTIDARPGGRFLIRYPNGTEASGEVLDVMAPRRIVFTYGYLSGTPIPPGASRVTISLEAAGIATRLHLVHEFTDAAVRDEHVQGWRYQLSLFGNVVADEVFAGAGKSVDAWFAAWSEPDASRQVTTLAQVASPHVRFRDRFSLVDGLPDLLAHLAAYQRFMPGLRVAREGEIRHCQGTVLADWVARAADGAERGRGTNVFVLGVRGQIESVIGFWNAMPGNRRP
jgi:uncharacterized protein YndB with AHSA1/START domain